MDDLRRVGYAVTFMVEGYETDLPVLYEGVPTKAVDGVTPL